MPPPIRAASPFGIAYRAEREDDLAFLATLYASARADEFAGLGWPADRLGPLMAQQFQARQRHYRRVYPAAEWLIVEAGESVVGRLAVERRETELHLIDIALVPELRGAGLGGAILADLIAEADALGLPVILQVDEASPARHLYERLGFVVQEERPPYLQMERLPGAP